MLITKEDMERIQQYEDDYLRLRAEMFAFIRKYGLVDLLRVIANVFTEVKGE